jgi:hypothetical protein
MIMRIVLFVVFLLAFSVGGPAQPIFRTSRVDFLRISDACLGQLS